MKTSPVREAFTNLPVLTVNNRTYAMVSACVAGETYDAIGRAHGVTRERVRQILEKLVRRMKRQPFLVDFDPVAWERVHREEVDALRPYFPLPATEEEKRAAWREYQRAKGKRILVPKDTCEVCGDTPQRAYGMIGHHTDYSRPLDVVWVCSGCHSTIHLYARQAA